MRGISWTCRGIGNPQAVVALCEIVTSCTADFVFLIETLVQSSKIEDIKRKLGFAGCFSVDRIGRGGCVAFLRRKQQNCSIIGFSKHHIDVVFQEDDRDLWRCTSLCGVADRAQRHESCGLLRTLRAQSMLSWCVMGDFNNLLSDEEKIGGAVYPPALFQGFREVVSNCGLVDLILSGHDFTWERGRGTDRWIAERLDRAMVTSEWIALFPEARLDNLVAPTSDHSPIMLSTKQRIPNYVSRRFWFENIWIEEPEFCDLVKSNWSMSSHLGLFNRLEDCISSMAKWGREFHMQFKDKLRQCKSTLVSIRGSTNPTNVISYTRYRNEMAAMLWQEEVYWKQRAKRFWLKGGDSNTKFFHASASSRKRNNCIMKLQNAAGTWVASSEEMQKVAVGYFENFFSVDCVGADLTIHKS